MRLQVTTIARCYIPIVRSPFVLETILIITAHGKYNNRSPVHRLKVSEEQRNHLERFKTDNMDQLLVHNGSSLRRVNLTCRDKTSTTLYGSLISIRQCMLSCSTALVYRILPIHSSNILKRNPTNLRAIRPTDTAVEPAGLRRQLLNQKQSMRVSALMPRLWQSCRIMMAASVDGRR
jgi:hypothetical protein